MQICNKIGLEAEFLLRDGKGNLVFPGKHGFDTDEFEILGEFRAEAGFYRHTAVASFVKELLSVVNRAEDRGLSVDFTGYAEITPKQKIEIMKQIGTKAISESDNVYNSDILGFSDDIVKKGVITASRISAGLHIHFSRRAYFETTVVIGKHSQKVVDDVNILTASQIKSMVRNLDKNLLPHYKLPVNLKYRQPGFYEVKPWGFEYRSLPMTPDFTQLNVLTEVVDYAFSLLERLEK